MSLYAVNPARREVHFPFFRLINLRLPAGGTILVEMLIGFSSESDGARFSWGLTQSVHLSGTGTCVPPFSTPCMKPFFLKASANAAVSGNAVGFMTVYSTSMDSRTPLSASPFKLMEVLGRGDLLRVSEVCLKKF